MDSSLSKKLMMKQMEIDQDSHQGMSQSSASQPRYGHNQSELDYESERLDDVDSEQSKQQNLTAKEKMKELAKKIYDSTPGIVE